MQRILPYSYRIIKREVISVLTCMGISTGNIRGYRPRNRPVNRCIATADRGHPVFQSQSTPVIACRAGFYTNHSVV